MKNTLVSACLIFILITGCKYQAMWVAGVREPKIENKKSIQKFMKKIHQDTVDTYTIDSTVFKSLGAEPFKPGWPAGFRPIQISAYNNKGKIVMKWASCEGFLKDLKTFDSIPPKNVNGLDSTLTLSEDLKRYSTLDGKPAHILIPDDYNYYFVVYFAKYFPKMTKETFRQIAHYKSIHPDLKIKIYKINVDFQEFWGMDLKIDLEVNGKKK